MESLLCNEIWPMSPNVQENDCACILASPFLFTTKEDCEAAIATFLGKETRYLPEASYVKLVERSDLISNARCKAVNLIIKSQTRMDLCSETIFAAVNYLDRFISLISDQCQGWKCWMFELLTIACLSIAAKINETTAYSLHEFQEDQETSFDPGLIQRMELTVLKALDWRVDSLTPLSYIHLLTHACDKTLIEELTTLVTQLLIDSLTDTRFLEFPQFVMAISAFRAVLHDLFPSAADSAWLAHLESLIPQHHRDDLIRCMEKLVEQNGKISMRGSSCSSPSSPVTVLKVDLFSCYDFRAAEMANKDLTRRRKRKREEEDTSIQSRL